MLRHTGRALQAMRPLQLCALSSITPASRNSLAMQTFGPEDAPKTVVFLHGIMGNKRNWRNPALMLCKKNPDIKCITVDLRGHGESQNLPGANTVRNCAEDLYDTFQTHNIQPTVLAAHSFGGKVAVSYLDLTRDIAKAPEATWILDSMPGLYSMKRKDNSVMEVLDVVHDIPKTFPSRDWLLKDLEGKGLSSALAHWLCTNVVNSKPECYLNLNIEAISELMKDFCELDMWPILQNYSADEKIVYLRAANNRGWPDETVARLKQLEIEKKNSIQYLEMPNVGHWLHSENPAGLIDIMMVNSDLL
jgi:esterase